MKAKVIKPQTEDELLAEIQKLLKNLTQKEPYITNTAKRIYWLVEDYTKGSDHE